MTISVFGCFKSKSAVQTRDPPAVVTTPPVAANPPVAEATQQRSLVPVAAVAKKVGSTEEPGARLCPSPPLDLAMLSTLSYNGANKNGRTSSAGRVSMGPRAVKPTDSAASMVADDNGLKPLPEEAASLDPRLLVESINDRRGRTAGDMSLLLSPRKKPSKVTAPRKGMSLVLTPSDREELESEAGLNGSLPTQIQTVPSSKRHGRKAFFSVFRKSASVV
ncbi:unnamed protein product [Ostreobium quekettii]|uniref:Uncharacterized protein n=1 Tax=Ostreobium quekettii TaxID=121088 RepID=A0A8S1IWH8_9CHLO|nr:unnamed protein product [Ostreobium quekettii]|eukprot:evm.model.scf_166.12 EVM.evm.TU.scf_166.12   scf_166:73155-75561(-)